MRARPLWLWAGAGIDLLLLPPALYMAASAAEIARETGWAGFADGIAVLFAALPIFCAGCPFMAFRAHGRLRSSAARGRFHLAVLVAAPVVYGIFLVLFVIKS
jgi:hypothetical protein